MPSRPLNTLQAGRGIACLVVLFYHLNLTLLLPKYLGREVFPFWRSGNSGVAFFFVLSGFVIFLAHDKDLGHPAKLPAFLWKRFRRVYPVLWIVLLVLVAVFYINPALGRGGRSISAILGSFLLTPAPDEFLLAPEWTLRHEVLFYLVFSAVIWNEKRGMLLAGVWLAMSGALPWLHLRYPWSFLFTTNHLLFAAGAAVCAFYKQGRLRKLPALLCLAAGMTLFALAWHRQLTIPLASAEAMNLLYGVGAAVMILGLVVLERDYGLSVPALLTFLGQASYSIYLVHLPALTALIKVELRVAARHPVPDALLFGLTALLSVGVGVLFHLVIEQPLLALVTAKVRIPVLDRPT